MPAHRAQPSFTESSALLFDLLCTPLSMRADGLGALVTALAPLVSPRATPEARHPLMLVTAARRPARAEGGAEDDDDEADDPDTAPWDEPIYAVDAGVAVVEVSGPVVKGYSNLVCWYYGLMSSDRLQAALAEIGRRTDVLGVVLVIRSPGGMCMGTPEAAAAIAALNAQKLVVAVTDTQACSAAYWMASQASALFTTVSADVGSIGTYLALYDWTKYLEEWGIKLELFKRGKFKAIGVMGNPLDKAAREFLDRDIGRINDRFQAAVRAARPGVADSTMEGQWFDGEEAVELRLADEVVASVDEVVTRVRAGVAGALASAARFTA